jgi:hypothetical protein
VLGVVEAQQCLTCNEQPLLLLLLLLLQDILTWMIPDAMQARCAGPQGPSSTCMQQEPGEMMFECKKQLVVANQSCFAHDLSICSMLVRPCMQANSAAAAHACCGQHVINDAGCCWLNT